MSAKPRIALDWKKLFAFEQVERDRQEKLAQGSIRLGAKIGDKIGDKVGTKEGIKKAV